MIKHFRRWNIWRKHCMNSMTYKIFVLIGIIDSPTFSMTLLPDELTLLDKIFKGDRKAESEGEK